MTPALDCWKCGASLVDFRRVGEVTTNGIDWAIEYRGLQVGPGTLALHHQGTFVNEYEEPGNTVGPGDVDFASPFAIPEYRLNFGADYDIGAFSFGWQGRMISELETLNFDGNNFLNYGKVPEHWEHDVLGRWKVSDSITTTLGVNNVFDEDPEYVFSTGNNTSTDLYGSAVTGRWYFLQFRADF